MNDKFRRMWEASQDNDFASKMTRQSLMAIQAKINKEVNMDNEFKKKDAVLINEETANEYFIVDEILEDGSLKIYTIIQPDEVDGHRPWNYA